MPPVIWFFRSVSDEVAWYQICCIEFGRGLLHLDQVGAGLLRDLHFLRARGLGFLHRELQRVDDGFLELRAPIRQPEL